MAVGYLEYETERLGWIVSNLSSELRQRVEWNANGKISLHGCAQNCTCCERKKTPVGLTERCKTGIFLAAFWYVLGAKTNLHELCFTHIKNCTNTEHNIVLRQKPTKTKHCVCCVSDACGWLCASKSKMHAKCTNQTKRCVKGGTPNWGKMFFIVCMNGKARKGKEKETYMTGPNKGLHWRLFDWHDPFDWDVNHKYSWNSFINSTGYLYCDVLLNVTFLDKFQRIQGGKVWIEIHNLWSRVRNKMSECDVKAAWI